MHATNFIESRLASAVINELPQNLKVTHCQLSKFPCNEMGLFFFVYCRILHDSKIELDLEATEALSSSDGTLSYKRSFTSKISSCLICLRFKFFFKSFHSIDYYKNEVYTRLKSQLINH